MRNHFKSSWIIRIIVLVMILLIFTGPGFAEVVQKPGGGTPWTPFPGDFPLTPAFPDTASRYDTFVFKPHTGDFDILKVSGRFPYARYFSFNLYDYFVATDIGAFADVEIVPDAGSVNPYDIGQDRSAANRDYTLWLVKEGVTVPAGAANVIILPPDIETLSLFTRVYRPDRGMDDLGGVSLPVIEALNADLSSGQAPEFGLGLEGILAKIPDFFLNEDLITCHQFQRQFCGNEVVFHRVSDAGLFPNAHNEYITAAMPPDYFNKVAVVTFTPPTFEDTFDGDAFEGGKDVRYWSLCIGGLGETRTTNCLCDDQVVPNADGTVTVCIAPAYLQSTIEAAGLNHLAWGAVYRPLLLHRHMLADPFFPGSISNVPAIDRPPAPEDRNQEYYEDNMAIHYMDEYCPTGEVYTIWEFMRWLRR